MFQHLGKFPRICLATDALPTAMMSIFGDAFKYVELEGVVLEVYRFHSLEHLGKLNIT